MNNIPQVLNAFRVYLYGRDLLGIADVELPEFSAVTAEVKGAGIAGKLDAPVVGHFDSLALKLNWRTVTGNLLALSAPTGNQLDLRGVVQEYNAGDGTYKQVPVKVVVITTPKKIALGKLSAGEAMESNIEFECAYLKLWYAGEEKVEIDKLNYKCVIGGVDYLEEVRVGLGLAG